MISHVASIDMVCFQDALFSPENKASQCELLHVEGIDASDISILAQASHAASHPFQVNLEYVALVVVKDMQLKMKIEFSIPKRYWVVIHHEFRPLAAEDNLARLHLSHISLH